MGGIRLGGIAEVVAPQGLIPMTLWSIHNFGFELTYGAVWGMSMDPGQDPVRYTGLYDASDDDDVMDAITNPAGTKIVYATTPIGAGNSKIFLAEFPLVPGSSNAGNLLDSNPSTLVVSMHPSWSPVDDDLVVYRTMDNSPNECEIRTVEPSVGAASITSLKTVSRALGNVAFPRFNFDGSRIAYALDDEIWVMDADGSNAQQVFAGNGIDIQGGWNFAWSPTEDKLAYTDLNGSNFTVIKTVNGDGTGTTTIFTDPSGNIAFWGLTLYPWSPDGTQLFLFLEDGPGSPDFRLYAVEEDGSGGAPLSPDRTSFAGNNDQLAYVYGQRVYWFADQFPDDGDVVSCALDGSDLRVEFTCDELAGTAAPIAQFVSGFYYRLNQPS